MHRARHPESSLHVPVTSWTRLHFAWSVLWIAILTAVFTIGYLGTRIVRRSTEHFAWWARHWGRSMMRMMGIRVSATGLQHLEHGTPYVFVANHQNGLDIPVVADCLPVAFGFVAKAELERVPFLGAALRYSPSVFVDRTDGRRTLESMQSAGREIRSGSSVLVFPEGARSYDGRLGPFQKGAFLLAVEAGVPVVPITIVDGPAVFDESRRVSRPGVIRVVIGKPIPLAGLSRRNIPDLMDQVFRVIAEPLPEAWRNPQTGLP